MEKRDEMGEKGWRWRRLAGGLWEGHVTQIGPPPVLICGLHDPIGRMEVRSEKGGSGSGWRRKKERGEEATANKKKGGGGERGRLGFFERKLYSDSF